ncbi:hypothetical protein H5410_056543 [Solanum commersonii]|uniref:Uncharacterized protein n=1 Tax=Solanum commersonii TaxID=4109 RepID=A0A9J5WKI1_SOLCO|nr:hypothetical protein H5410_056543 [Solanum commersonii]
MTLEIWITKSSMDYSIRKSAKRVVYPFWGLFNLENGLDYSSKPTDYIAKTIPHKNWQNGGFTHSRDPLTLTMGRFTYRDQPTP